MPKAEQVFATFFAAFIITRKLMCSPKPYLVISAIGVCSLCAGNYVHVHTRTRTHHVRVFVCACACVYVCEHGTFIGAYARCWKREV